MATTMGSGLTREAAGGVAPAVDIRDLTNDALVIRLTFAPNFLSRWLTPIHDAARLARSPRRGEPSPKDILLRMRDEELRRFPQIHLISTRTAPDLDKLPPPTRIASQQAQDRASSAFEVMAEFRRLRTSTCSHLRALPDDAWDRRGGSRRERDWTVRTLAEYLARHDLATLTELDEALDRGGVREGIAAVSRVHLPELLRLVPVETRR